MEKINISLKRVGLTDEYKLSNLKNRTSFEFQNKKYKVGSRIGVHIVDKLCLDGKFHVTVRA